MSKQLERVQLFEYLLIQCEHKEALVGDTHWHVCHAGSGEGICVTNHRLEATVIAYGLALYDRLSVSEQLQILGESQTGTVEMRPITADELWAYLGAVRVDSDN